jgi:Transcriptional regulator, AbiEi antitoxin, Type IV TA system
MLKPSGTVKGLEKQAVSALTSLAVSALTSLLEEVPTIRVRKVSIDPDGPDHGIDILAKIDVANRRRSIVCEVKSSGQPRHVRLGLLQLHHYVAQQPDVVPIFIAPYLSAEARALCREQKVGFLDLEGNARLAFDGVFIERLVPTRPAAARRELKSVFKPKSARILRVLLRDPNRAWRVAELADAAQVSFGHVSNVRSILIDSEWAQLSEGGLVLSKPDSLLDAWREAYESPAAGREGFYTTLHGRLFDEAARRALSSKFGSGRIAFASFSAAQWLAPYGRTVTHYFYAEEDAVVRLKSDLKLAAIQKGENVVVMIPKDNGLFLDVVEPAPGAVCTSPVQTYLDLANAGERGREAADHLRHEKLSWR